MLPVGFWNFAEWMALPRKTVRVRLLITRYKARPVSLLTEEEVWQEVGHVLVELILRGQQHRLVVDEQQ